MPNTGCKALFVRVGFRSSLPLPQTDNIPTSYKDMSVFGNKVKGMELAFNGA